MAINTEIIYRNLYDNLDSKGYHPHAENASTGKEVVPEEADFLTFDVELGDGVTPVTVSVDKVKDKYSLTVYFTDEAKENADDHWYGVLKDLRQTARNSGIKTFSLRNRNHLAPDMQKRTYMKKQEQIAEGYYPMGKKGSYNDSIPSVKIVIEHTRQIEEGEQRFRNINRIFLENEQGERILAPTTRPGIAKVYARVIAEGDFPHGERWNHVNSLVEEYTKMAGFVRATRGHQFNESAQKLVESGIAHYNSLRETLSRMTGHRGYNAYFESWTPPLMEDDSDTSNLNELFVQETLDPRIESVMPILSKLQKNISEMSEVSELAEWADNLLEAPGAETLAHNQETEKSNLKAMGLAEEDEAELEPAEEELEEGDGGQDALNPIGIPEEKTSQAYRDAMAAHDSAGRENRLQQAKDRLAQRAAEPKTLGQKIAKDIGGPLKKLAKGDIKGALSEMPDTQFHEEIEEDGQFAGDYKTGPAGQWRNKGPKANKPAQVGDLVGASESAETDEEAIVEGQDDLEAIMRLVRK